MNSDFERPILEVPASPTDMAVEVFALIGLALILVLAVTSFPMLPDRIPAHFNTVGTPNDWGPKSTLWLLPGLGALLYVLLTVVSFFPHKFNYLVAITEENAPRQYAIAKSAIRWLKMEIVCLLAYTEWATIQTALGRARGMRPLALALMLAVITGTGAMLLVRSYRAK